MNALVSSHPPYTNLRPSFNTHALPRSPTIKADFQCIETICCSKIVKTLKRKTVWAWTSDPRSPKCILQQQTPPSFPTSTAYNKVKESLSVNIQPSQSNYKLTSIFLQDLINNPRAKIDPGVAKELSESPLSRYSFVCNVNLDSG